MTVRIYKSTDGSAPVLTGEVGKLVALLDACLVNGYGALPAAGWTKPFSGTNTAAYRNSSSLGTGFYLDVNDNGPGGQGAREARLRGYETMSAVATGTGPFPTVAQSTDGLFCRKSSTANTTARAWTILADETVFYLFTETVDTAAPWACTFCFGDFFSFKSNDAYRAIIIGRHSESSASGDYDNLAKINNSGAGSSFLATVTSGHFIPRIAAGTGTSVDAGKFLVGPTAATGMGSSGFTYPSVVNNGLFMSPVFVGHGGDSLRGYLKGLWGPLHAVPITSGDTFSGVGALAGKSFLARGAASGSGANVGQIMLETSNTWS